MYYCIRKIFLKNNSYLPIFDKIWPETKYYKYTRNNRDFAGDVEQSQEDYCPCIFGTLLSLQSLH